MLLVRVRRLAAAACSSAVHSLCNVGCQNTVQYSTSAELIGICQGILSKPEHGLQSETPFIQADHLRQLLNEAIQVYKAEGAAAVVPDQVTEVFMGVYNSLHTPHQRLTFFTMLAREFGVQSGNVDAAVQLWQQKCTLEAGASPELLYRVAERLTAAAQPLYMQLLLPVSQHKAGIAFLVRLRTDLLALLRDQPGLPQGAALRALSQDLRSAFARWFSVGLLHLQRITWEDSPGQLLERVMRTEAVHRMQHMEELKRRLQQSDRRVFAFLHPSLPCEPLVVLHTAIMNHIPCSMDAVLAPPSTRHTPSYQQAATAESGSSGPPDHTVVTDDEQQQQLQQQLLSGTVACFYSISSGQLGLSGVDLGNFLIKKAAQQLLPELPHLKHLVTLSPIPGFRAWLITKLRQDAAASMQQASSGNDAEQAIHPVADPHASYVLYAKEATVVSAAYEQLKRQQQRGCSSSVYEPRHDAAELPGATLLLELVQTHAWLQLPEEHQQALQNMLMRLCAVYLLQERRRGFALDPVAHFHLKNGAWLWRINSRADMSEAGLERSCGLMVNYKYILGDVSANNRAYLVDHTIAASDSVKQLLMAR